MVTNWLAEMDGRRVAVDVPATSAGSEYHEDESPTTTSIFGPFGAGPPRQFPWPSMKVPVPPWFETIGPA